MITYSMSSFDFTEGGRGSVAMSIGMPPLAASIRGSKPFAFRKYSLASAISPFFLALRAASLNSFCLAIRS